MNVKRITLELEHNGNRDERTDDRLTLDITCVAANDEGTIGRMKVSWRAWQVIDTDFIIDNDTSDVKFTTPNVSSVAPRATADVFDFVTENIDAIEELMNA